MGMYVNPGNEGFARIASGDYVDKTGLISLVNDVIGTARNMVAITRPRRFGKTFAAESLVAYYSCGCDSRLLFEGLDISRDPGFDKHLNAYNVVRLDMTAFQGTADVAAAAKVAILGELREIWPDAGLTASGRADEITAALTDVVNATKRRFVFVIDEWDAPLRERRSKESQENWVYFLRLLFKNFTFTAKAVAAAYMTGILPIVRYGTQSALSDFREYTMLSPDDYAPYVGFVEADVELLAKREHMDIHELRRWYDGYGLPYYDNEDQQHKTLRCYAPYSVAEACYRHRVGRYWVDSEAFSSLRFYIDMDFGGLQQTIVQALGGASVQVDTGTFENDMHEVASANDVLTLLCHLGYLAYDSSTETARVPNEEVRTELRRAISESRHTEIARIIHDSASLLRTT